MEYAIIKAGGKQYRVTPGDVIDVEKLPTEAGAEVELTEVLAVSRDGETILGRPLVPGAKVIAQVQSQYKDKKLMIFKYKAKTRYRRKRGHRQPYTRLAVVEIVLGEGESDGP